MQGDIHRLKISAVRSTDYVEELAYEISLRNGLGLLTVRMTKQLNTGK